jgi:hypothetical protein
VDLCLASQRLGLSGVNRSFPAALFPHLWEASLKYLDPAIEEKGVAVSVSAFID